MEIENQSKLIRIGKLLIDAMSHTYKCHWKCIWRNYIGSLKRKKNKLKRIIANWSAIFYEMIYLKSKNEYQLVFYSLNLNNYNIEDGSGYIPGKNIFENNRIRYFKITLKIKMEIFFTTAADADLLFLDLIFISSSSLLFLENYLRI